ncbi:MAG: IS6 family transposase [Cyanobacteria bacterium P01_H01_bin.15]
MILLNVRWYARYSLSYRDFEEMMTERGRSVDHSTINRWLSQDGPGLDKRYRPHLRPNNDSWKVDETYVKVKGYWKYLYRAVVSNGQTPDFMLSVRRNAKVAKLFLRETFKARNTVTPSVINVDKNAAYPAAVNDLKIEEALPEETEHRAVKYPNNQVEQDHRYNKRLVKPSLGFGSFNTARQTLKGYEAIAMIRKGQIQNIGREDVTRQISFIHQIFGRAALIQVRKRDLIS